MSILEDKDALFLLDRDQTMVCGDGPIAMDFPAMVKGDCTAIGNQKLVHELMIPGRNYWIGQAKAAPAKLRCMEGIQHWHDFEDDAWQQKNEGLLLSLRNQLGSIKDDVPKIMTIWLIRTLTRSILSVDELDYSQFIVVDDQDISMGLHHPGWLDWHYVSPESVDDQAENYRRLLDLVDEEIETVKDKYDSSSG